MLRIFQFLPKNCLCQIARVCRRFYFLAWEAELWTHIDLNVKNCDLALTSLMRHLSRDSTSQNVLKICLKNSSEFSDRGLELICQTCPNLRHFEVKNCKSVTNFGVQSLLQKCKALSHLDLAGKKPDNFYPITSDIWGLFWTPLTNVKSDVMSGCSLP